MTQKIYITNRKYLYFNLLLCTIFLLIIFIIKSNLFYLIIYNKLIVNNFLSIVIFSNMKKPLQYEMNAIHTVHTVRNDLCNKLVDLSDWSSHLFLLSQKEQALVVLM